MLKNVSFETIYSNKFTLSTQAYNTKLPYLKSELRPKGFQIVVDVLLKIIIINNIVDAAFSSYTASLSVPCYSRASVSCLPSAARFCSGVLEGVVRGSFRFLQLGYCARPAGKKTLTGQRPYISWITALWFWRQSRPCHWTEGTCLDHVTISCLECRQHLMNQLSAKSYFWGRGICRKLDPNLTHTFHTFLNFIIDIFINKHHFKNKLWLRVANYFPHVSQSNIHSG